MSDINEPRPSAPLRRDLARRLLAWYARHQRPLPWRLSRDPYRVWVAEIMLQQTQVETVIPYYQRWLARFPSVRALARAPQQAVLAVWEGLGYYSRARNLHRAARQVMAEHGGVMPASLEGLRRLPGIGRYTAGAIASIAFGADAAVLDGNVKRVLARAFDVRMDVKSAAGEKRLWALAESLVPAGRAGDYNQALMDLGATVCTPRAPDCPACPLRRLCLAYQLGVQHERPVAGRRAPAPVRTYAAGVVRKNGRVLLAQRPAARQALLGGLWAFPSAPIDPAASPGRQLRRALRQEFGIEAAVGAEEQRLAHGFTHFRLDLRVLGCQWRAGPTGRRAPGGAPLRWVRVGDLDAYPMARVDRLIARRLQAER